MQTINLHSISPVLSASFLPDTDLALRFLSLRDVSVGGSFTVGAVTFTVVIGFPGVCHYQQLLDASLEEKQKRKSSMSTEAKRHLTPVILNWEAFFCTVKSFDLSALFLDKKKSCKSSVWLMLKVNVTVISFIYFNFITVEFFFLPVYFGKWLHILQSWEASETVATEQKPVRG